MRKFLRYMFVGYFTKENIPSRKVRHAALMATYSSAFYALQSMYYRDKLRVMAELVEQGRLPFQFNRSDISFRDYLRYEGYEGTADLLDRMLVADFPQHTGVFGIYGSDQHETGLISLEEHEKLEF